MAIQARDRLWGSRVVEGGDKAGLLATENKAVIILLTMLVPFTIHHYYP